MALAEGSLELEVYGREVISRNWIIIGREELVYKRLLLVSFRVSSISWLHDPDTQSHAGRHCPSIHVYAGSQRGNLILVSICKRHMYRPVNRLGALASASFSSLLLQHI